MCKRLFIAKFFNNEKFKKFKEETNKTGTTEEALANADNLGFNTNLFYKIVLDQN